MASEGRQGVSCMRRKIRIFIFNLNFVLNEIKKKNGWGLKYGGPCWTWKHYVEVVI